jgi:hypothetical protein
MARRSLAFVASMAVMAALAPAAQAADRSCRPPGPKPTRVVQTPPSADLLGRMEVLRRPQSDADRAYLDRLQHSLFQPTISGPYVRVLGRTADDTEVVLVPGTQQYPILPRRCLRGLSPGRRRAQRDLRKRAHEIRLTVVGFGAGGMGGWGAGSADARALVNNRTTVTIGQQWGGSIVNGLAPDGVATIDLTFTRGEARRATVANNFWSTVVSTSAPHAFPVRTVWRAADGSVVKTFRDDAGR